MDVFGDEFLLSFGPAVEELGNIISLDGCRPHPMATRNVVASMGGLEAAPMGIGDLSATRTFLGLQIPGGTAFWTQ